MLMCREGAGTQAQESLEPNRVQPPFPGSPQVSKGEPPSTDFCCNSNPFTVAKTILIDGANQSKAVNCMNTYACAVTKGSYQSWLKKESEHQQKPGKQNPPASC